MQSQSLKEAHKQKILSLQQQIQKNQGAFCLKTADISNTLRDGRYKLHRAQLDLSSFTAIIEINHEQAWALVEPRITIKKLTHSTLKLGLAPEVVPEFTSITVGGAIMGSALESSSHKFGQFNDGCLEYECLLGDGSLVVASRNHFPDLFFGCSGSYGTLAIITAVKLRLIKTKKWVKLTIRRYHEIAPALQALREETSVDFLEGVCFSREKTLVVSGAMQDSCDRATFRQNRSWSQWYAHHLTSTDTAEECMPLEEYLFRFDRGAFWMGQYAHSFLTMVRLLLRLGKPKAIENARPPSLLFRLAFGWALSSARLYRLWHRIPSHVLENLFFVHDFYVPAPKALEALLFFLNKTEIYPIWLCPVKGSFDPQFLSPHFGAERFINIGLYGIPHVKGSVAHLSAELEKALLTFGGRKMLYSFTYYDQKIFEQNYFEERYNTLRQTYSAENAFPSLYNKVTNKSSV